MATIILSIFTENNETHFTDSYVLSENIMFPFTYYANVKLI